MVESFETKFHKKDYEWMVMKIYVIELCHVTKIAAVPIYGKTYKKIFCSRTNGPMALELGI